MAISLGLLAKTGYLVTSVAALVFRPARRATCRARFPARRGRFGDCCREDCPFHSATTVSGGAALVTVALALSRGRPYGLSGPTTGPARVFTRHPALRSSDFPLPRTGLKPLVERRKPPSRPWTFDFGPSTYAWSSGHPAHANLAQPFVVYCRPTGRRLLIVVCSGAGTRTPTY